MCWFPCPAPDDQKTPVFSEACRIAGTNRCKIFHGNSPCAPVSLKTAKHIQAGQGQPFDVLTAEIKMRGSRTISETCTLTHGDYGVFLTLSKDNVVGASIANAGAWASHDLETMSQFIKPGMTVVDVGANVGHHTVAFAKMVGNAGRVIAYEPQNEMFRLLAANCVINGCRNVDIHQTCVGETAGEVRLFPTSYEETNNFGGLGIDPQSIDGGAGPGELCRIDSLDSLLAGSGVPSCDFIKIDVQAFELFVLRGGGENDRGLQADPLPRDRPVSDETALRLPRRLRVALVDGIRDAAPRR